MGFPWSRASAICSQPPRQTPAEGRQLDVAALIREGREQR